MGELAWINGKIEDLTGACVPLEDRGFLFGDGIYEALRIYAGVPFALEEHLQRLERSAAAIMLEIPYTSGVLASHIREFIAQSGCRDGYIYIQLTRGAAPRNHNFPAGAGPNLVMFIRGLAPGHDDHAFRGEPCITLPDERWLRCDIKSINLLPNVIARETAARAGAFEAILHRPDGAVTEGSRSNVFALIDGTVRTHPHSNLILPGITRGFVIEILRQAGVPLEEKAFTLAELRGASEIWLSSSVAEVTPVTALDGVPVGPGLPGKTALLVVEAYRRLARAG